MSSIDPGKILSYGAIGLGFLLALLSYMLLASEQKRVAPRVPMIQAIYAFMSFAFLLSILGFGSEYLKDRLLGPSKDAHKRVLVSLLGARPTKTTIGDANASQHEIENILTGVVATAIEKKCLPTQPDRELHGNIAVLIYSGGGGYGSNVGFDNTNFDQNTQDCVSGIFLGTTFPEPLNKDPRASFDQREYWITAKIELPLSTQH
jgi:hypothetical protein